MASALNVITGNSLADGLVIFQTAAGWALALADAELLETPEALAAAMQRANADAAANRVVEPYAIEVVHRGGRLVPQRLRERIRADGPTTGHSRDHLTAERAA